MITLIRKSGTIISFNLKSFDREKAMRDAWHAMRDDPLYEKRRFKFVTTSGAAVDVGFTEIEDLKFDDAEYFNVDPDQVYSDSHPMPKHKPGPKSHQVFRDIHPMVRKFRDELNRRGIEPDFRDPIFKQILEKVPRATDAKIPMYANIYENHLRSKGVR